MNDQSKTKQALIQESAPRKYAESIIDTVREPLIVLDHNFRVVSASRSFYKIFKINPEEMVGQLIYNRGNKARQKIISESQASVLTLYLLPVYPLHSQTLKEALNFWPDLHGLLP